MKICFDEPIYAWVDLPNDNGSFYPVAFIKDDTNTQIAGPIALTHCGDGYYQDKSEKMPNTPRVVVDYKIYSDDTLTTLSNKFTLGPDIYFLDKTAPKVGEILDTLNGLKAGSFPGETLEGFIEDDTDELEGHIEC